MPKAESSTTSKRAPAKKAAAAKPAPADEPMESLDSDFGFAPIDDVIDHTNTLLYGREGSGKTTSAARLVNSGTGRLLIINAEGGLRKKALHNRGIDTSRIVVWPDPKKHERVTHQSLDRINRKIKADLEADPDSWVGVVMDSATEVFTAILDSVQKKRITAIRNRGQDVDEDHVDIADYGTMSKLFRDQLRKFRDLPCHFVVTALERRDVDKDTGKPQYGPAVTPGLQSDLLGYVDFVLMCKAEDEDGPFRALTRANSRFRAKDRFDVLPRILVDPYLDRVIGYVNGDLTEDTDPDQSRYAKGGADVNKADDTEVEEDTEDDEPDEDSDK